MEMSISNDVLVERLDGLKEILASRFEENAEQHSRIEAHVAKTNGRVTSLEQAKNMIWGGLIITNIIIVPVAVGLFINYLRQ